MLKRLFTQVDIASLVFFRLVFGILAFADIMGLWTYYHLWIDSFNPDKFQFKYYGFEWVQPMPEPFMSLFFILLLVAAIFVTIGYKYRASAIFLFLGFTYVFLLEKTHYLNHGYLFCWLTFVMIWLPANRDFSKDVADRPSLHLQSVPYYNIFILQFFMAVVYFYGGLAKINADWLLKAMPLTEWISYKSNMPILGPIWDADLTGMLMSWAGMLLDLLVVFFLFFRKTRLPALFFVLFFHLTNTLIFKIGIFPWLSIGFTLMFFPPMRPRLWVDWLAEKLKLVKNIKVWWQKKVNSKAPIIGSQLSKLHKKENLPSWVDTFEQGKLEALNSRNKAILVVLSIVMLFHLLMPFRQYLYPGPTAWTEEGHRYSWRMMLRQKKAYGVFEVASAGSNKRERINPKDHLTKEQARKMLVHPDMILQFAHYLRDTHEAQGRDSVQVYANIRAKLNGRKYQNFIKREVDLAQVEWSLFKHSDWIVPFEDTEIVWKRKSKK